MKKISVLLAGIGGYGTGYLNELLDAANLQDSANPMDSKDLPFFFAGAADPFAERSPRFAELMDRKIPVYKTPDEFFASGGKAGLTVIASPIHTHYPYIVTAFKNGSYVLCEKPVTGDLARLDDLITQEKKTGLFCAVGFQLCFARGTLALKKDIMDGVLGKPVEFKAIQMPKRGDKYYSRNNWAGKIRVEGELIYDSPLNNACGHDLQLMLFLLGNEMDNSAEVTSVKTEAWKARPDIENFDAYALHITTAAAAIRYYTAHCVNTPPRGQRGEFLFEKALVRWGENNNAELTAYFNDGRIKNYEVPLKNSIKEKFYDCLEAVKTGKPPYCTLKTVRNHLKCVTEAQKLPVKQIPLEKIVYEKNIGDEPWYYVPGLAEAFLKSYGENVLPSQTGFNPLI